MDKSVVNTKLMFNKAMFTEVLAMVARYDKDSVFEYLSFV